MEPNKISKIQIERLEKEKQIFPNCIQVRHQYSNKRKSSQGLSVQNRRSSKPSDENAYSARRRKPLEQSSTGKVAEWLQKCEENMPNTRMPFADLEPNIPSSRNESKQIVSKMCLRSSAPKAENKTRSFLKNINSPLVSGYTISLKNNQPKFIGQEGHKVKIPKKKAKDVTVDISVYSIGNKKNEDIETVLSISESSPPNDDEPITIEDSQETYVDKDYLACLAVEKAEAALLERCVHISPKKITSMKILPIKHSHLEGITKKRHSLKRKLPYMRALTNNIRIKKNRAKPRKNQSIQTDFSCSLRSVKKDKSVGFEDKLSQCDNLFIGNVRSPEYISSTPVEEEITDFGIIQEKNQFSENLFTEDYEKYFNDAALNRGEKEKDKTDKIDRKSKSDSPDIQQYANDIVLDHYEPTDNLEIYDAEEWTHNTSGNHTVRVLVHAPMQASDSDSDIIIEDTHDHLQRTPPRPSHSPSLVFDKDIGLQTPPRVMTVSPTFTSPTSNISNSSSNKENYEPNTTPIKDTKKMNDCKGKGSSGRMPFEVLFETSHIRVACSCLQPVQESLVMLACKRLGWTFCHEFPSGLTHLVVAVDEDNRAHRTARYVCALAAGCWVVSYQWIMKSLTHECHQDEESFEVLDCTGEEGPRHARTSNFKLFTGLAFHCLDSITTIPRGILEWALEAAGGRLSAETAAVAEEEPVITLHEPVEGVTDNNAEVAAAPVVLDYQWVVESLGRYQRLCPDPFVLHVASPQSFALVTSLCGDIL